ncbi:MAG: Do family serine endopeptidase [Candidatus Omnitrophota bacterium]
MGRRTVLVKHNQRYWIIALVTGLVGGFLLAAEHKGLAGTDAVSLQESFVSVAKQVGPAVVSISTEHTERVGLSGSSANYGDNYAEEFFREFFGYAPEREYKQRGLGSGFIIDAQGYILTNQHVIEGADKITVTLADGRKFNAEIKGSDERSDLAVVKIEANELPVAKLGNSEQVEIGQWAIAIGNPYGYIVGSAEPTVTVGIVSALSRSLAQAFDQRSYIDLIQTDAAINPGNSGGPLVNINGEVIGINVAIFSPSGGNIGIGFAIPVNNAKDIVERLIAGKKVHYGWLGVSIQDLDEQLADHFGIADQQGALVLKVLSSSPAEQAGFQEGDVIKKFAGMPVKDMRTVLRLSGKTEVGEVVAVEIVRERKTIVLSVKVGERPQDIASATAVSVKTWRGLEVSDISEELARQYRISEQEGVVVTNVEAKSPAYAAGLIPGDVVTSINHRRTKNVSDYESVIAATQGPAAVLTDRGFTVVKELP